MRWGDLCRTVGFTFRGHPVRALLTLLGIMIGSGSLVALSGLLAGAEEGLMALNQGVNEGDTVRILVDEAPPAQLGRGAPPLSAADAEALAQAPSLSGTKVTPESRREAKARRGHKEKRVRLMGVDLDALSMYRLTIQQGRALDEADQLGRRVMVIGHEVATQLYGAESPLGHALEVDGERFLVVGVLAHKPVMGHGDGTWMWDRRVLIPRRTFDATFSPEHEIHSVFLRADRPRPSNFMTALGRAAEAVVLRRHHQVRNFKLEDRQGQAQEALILNAVHALLLFTGLLSLMVGGINVMNIMLVTVTERTVEIGLRRAVGATTRAIAAQFLLESGTLALVGGIAGCTLGLLASALLSWALAQAFGTFPFRIIPWSLVIALGLSFLTGVVFGLFPAWRATRLDPVVALRSA
ncbi:MAG: ABC transporter permease [Deltaproteobacteria bacterium]|nr:ABC transporter permease [Deltaproteobacteria bacterium]